MLLPDSSPVYALLGHGSQTVLVVLVDARYANESGSVAVYTSAMLDYM
jgi:hypothetical protein